MYTESHRADTLIKGAVRAMVPPIAAELKEHVCPQDPDKYFKC